MTDTLEQAAPADFVRLAPHGDWYSNLFRRDFRVGGPANAGNVTFHCGLPLRIIDGVPAAPQWSGATLLQLRLKRALLDIPLSVLALLLLCPLMLAVAVLIKATSRGPVVFRQRREGWAAREFEILKFRTMHLEDGEDRPAQQTRAEEERITCVGRLLRATSIDELPQLWNVLRGDMSLVGPRPMVREQQASGAPYHAVVPYYDYRFLVRPGLSGWAQANGLRGSTADLAAARLRIDYDCAYVQNFSLLLDLRIIFKTIVREYVAGTGR